MYIELTCQNCKKHFRVPFGTKEFCLKECPLCGISITHTDDARLYEITEKLHMNIDKLSSVAINGIYLEKDTCKKAGSMSNEVFYADIDHLTEVFKCATPDVQKEMTSLLDTLYLIIYHDSKDGAIDNLNATREKLRTMFLEKIDERNERGVQLLFNTEENNDA